MFPDSDKFDGASVLDAEASVIANEKNATRSCARASVEHHEREGQPVAGDDDPFLPRLGFTH